MDGLQEIRNKGTLADNAYKALKKAIFELNLKPGQLVLEDELANNLGVSRTPVRTALNRLSYESLIEVIPGKGTFVSQLTKKQFTDMMVVRKALDQVAVPHAALNRSQRDINDLKSFTDSMSSITKGEGKPNDLLNYINYDISYHNRIAKISGNPYLEKQLLSVTTNISRYILATLDREFIYDVDAEHSLILKYIIEKNPIEAARQAKTHLDNVEQRTLKLLLLNYRGEDDVFEKYSM